MTRPLIVLVAVASLLLIADPSSAQQASRNGNSRIGTLGDLPQGKLRARTSSFFGPRFGPGGLFGDAEVFGDFSQPRQFVFALPNFAGAGLDFNGVTFEDYLDLVAHSYELPDKETYKSQFLARNAFSVTNNLPLFFAFGDLQQQWFNVAPITQAFILPRLNDIAFDRFHESDFDAGGGFFPLPPDFVTPEPHFPPLPDDPTIPDPGDGPIFTPLPDGPIVPTSSSSSAPITASLVPEPATLALITMGAGLMLRRSRRR